MASASDVMVSIAFIGTPRVCDRQKEDRHRSAFVLTERSWTTEGRTPWGNWLSPLLSVTEISRQLHGTVLSAPSTLLSLRFWNPYLRSDAGGDFPTSA